MVIHLIADTDREGVDDVMQTTDRDNRRSSRTPTSAAWPAAADLISVGVPPRPCPAALPACRGSLTGGA